MERLIDLLKRNKLAIGIISVLIILIGGYFITAKHTPEVKNELKTEQKMPLKKVATEKSIKNANLVVDVQGAVKVPGVYRVKNGAIVQEVLQMAGGLNDNADVKQINQAKRVVDQMQVYVPTVGEKTNSTGTGSSVGESKIVNINSASVDDFKDVTGIGPKKAEKIIEYREKNGDFNELHDLTKVSGIGEKSLESLKDQLTV